jgi:hypothetical protein
MIVSLDGFVADPQGSASRLYPDLGDLQGTDYHLVTGRRGLRLLDRSLHALGDERERQVLVLLRWVRRWMVRDDEDRHLELVVADE